MRLELHLFLWVTACLAVGAALLRGENSQLQIPYQNLQSEELLALREPEQISPSSRFARIFVAEHVEDHGSVNRLFDMIPSTVDNDLSNRSELESQRIIPILKGIIYRDGIRVAVFAVEGSEYLLASEGEAVAGYVIRQIGNDGVVAIGGDREPLTFTLRGAGERP